MFMPRAINQPVDGEWVTFKGGELEGRRPRGLCPACRAQLARLARGYRAPSPEPRPICFQCYRVDLERQRALQAAGQLDTASVERFQDGLPFEPVNRARLDALKAERAEARQVLRAGVGHYVDKRRQAQIAARHALQRLAAGLDARALTGTPPELLDGRQLTPVLRDRYAAAPLHAAELQLPEAWLPFVGSR